MKRTLIIDEGGRVLLDEGGVRLDLFRLLDAADDNPTVLVTSAVRAELREADAKRAFEGAENRETALRELLNHVVTSVDEAKRALLDGRIITANDQLTGVRTTITDFLKGV